MPSILFLATKEARRNEFVRELQHADHRVVQAEPTHPEFETAAESIPDGPDVIVVDGSRLGFRAREAASYLKDKKAYREVPVVFFDVPDDDVKTTEQKVPGVRIVDLAGVPDAIDELTG